MIRLLIKGNAEEARAALDAHKLLTTTALETIHHGWNTRATVHDSDLATVAAWFAETAYYDAGVGWAPGTLIMYSHDSEGLL